MTAGRPTRRPAGRPRDPRSALRRQIDRALTKLGARAALRDGPVHDARKELKRARSTLRLLRDAIGDAAYRRADRRVRDAGRPLSPLRDARILLDVIAELRAKTKRARRGELDALARRLRSERERHRKRLAGRPGLARVRRSLESVRRESRSWPAPSEERLRGGLERMYRKGRKAFASAEKGSDETLHESRKQTKYLGKALETLAPAPGSAAAKRAKLAESIADALGDDHDLAVLVGKLSARRQHPARALIARIDRRRGKLQRRALKRSRRLYARKAKSFAGAVEVRGRVRAKP